MIGNLPFLLENINCFLKTQFWTAYMPISDTFPSFKGFWWAYWAYFSLKRTCCQNLLTFQHQIWTVTISTVYNLHKQTFMSWEYRKCLAKVNNFSSLHVTATLETSQQNWYKNNVTWRNNHYHRGLFKVWINNCKALREIFLLE